MKYYIYSWYYLDKEVLKFLEEIRQHMIKKRTEKLKEAQRKMFKADNSGADDVATYYMHKFNCLLKIHCNRGIVTCYGDKLGYDIKYKVPNLPNFSKEECDKSSFEVTEYIDECLRKDVLDLGYKGDVNSISSESY